MIATATMFFKCPSCEGEVQHGSTEDVNCGWCMATLTWEGKDGVGEWKVKTPASPARLKAIRDGTLFQVGAQTPLAPPPLAGVDAPKPEPETSPAPEAEAGAGVGVGEAEPPVNGGVKLADLAQELGVRSGMLLKAARQLEVFPPDRGSTMSVLTAAQAELLRSSMARAQAMAKAAPG